MEPEKMREIVKKADIEEDLLICENEMDSALRRASDCDLINAMFFLQSAGDKYGKMLDKIWEKAAAGVISVDEATSLERYIDAGKWKMYKELKRILEKNCGCRPKEIPRKNL